MNIRFSKAKNIFLLGIFLIVVACDYRVVRDPAVLVRTIPVDPAILNPLLITEMASFIVSNSIFDSMLEYDNETLRLKPALADGWEVSPDHLAYTFRLKKGVLWHDGVPFTADDVVFTFDAIRDPRVDAPQIRTYYRDLVRVEKAGDDAVRFVYSQPYFKAESLIGLTKIIPRHIFGNLDEFNVNPANRNPIGTGPFRFVKWDSGRRIELSRFEDYYGKKPALTGITYSIVPNKITAFQLMKKGAIDLADITSTQWTFQTKDESFREKFSRHRFYPPNYSFIGWNMNNSLFADRRVRLAMTMLLDRRQILEKVLFGLGEQVTGPFYRYGINYDDSVTPYPYDPAAAKRLLDEAGWKDTDGDGLMERDGRPFRFTMLIRSGDRFSRSVGLFLKYDLARIGIEMDLMQLEWATMIGKIVRREFDASIFAFGMPIEEDAYPVWHSSQADSGSNYLGFKNPKVDSILERARLEFDPEKRALLYKEIHRVIHEEQPCVFLFTSPTLTAVARRFEDVVDYRTGLDMMEWKIGPWPVLREW